MSDDQTLPMRGAFTGAARRLPSPRPDLLQAENDLAKAIRLEWAGALWNGRRQGGGAASARRAPAGEGEPREAD